MSTLLAVLLGALSALAVSSSLSAVKAATAASGPRERFELHAAVQLDRTVSRYALFDADGIAQMIRLAPAVAAISPFTQSMRPTIELGEERYELRSGAVVSPDYFTMGDVEIVAGSAFTWEEVEFGDRLALISESSAELIFPEGNAVGSQIRLLPERSLYRIVGVFRRVGGGVGPSIHLTQPVGQRGVSTLAVLARPGQGGNARQQVVAAARNVYAAELADLGHAAWEGFIVNSAGEVSSEASFIRRELGVFAILGVATLLVAGIGIFSMTIVETLERQREIGLRRAMGATRAGLVARLALDSGLLGVAGALPGVVIAALILPRLRPAAVASLGGGTGGLPFDYEVALLTVLAVALLSALSSLLPSLRAVAQRPVAALREE